MKKLEEQPEHVSGKGTPAAAAESAPKPATGEEGGTEATPATCRRCSQILPRRDPFHGFCSLAHRLAGRAQKQLLVENGPGCRRCFRGAVFFRWRPGSGRQRADGAAVESQHVAVCWCPAGRRLEGQLETGYKAWGFMMDYDGQGQRELAPSRSPLERCGGTYDPEGDTGVPDPVS